MGYRIPKYIDLPFGYEVEVRQLSHKAYVDQWGEGSYACWDVDDRVIYLDKSRDIKKRRADLAHEMLHAVSDWQVMVLGSHHADAKD